MRDPCFRSISFSPDRRFLPSASRGRLRCFPASYKIGKIRSASREIGERGGEKACSTLDAEACYWVGSKKELFCCYFFSPSSFFFFHLPSLLFQSSHFFRHRATASYAGVGTNGGIYTTSSKFRLFAISFFLTSLLCS